MQEMVNSIVCVLLKQKIKIINSVLSLSGFVMDGKTALMDPMKWNASVRRMNINAVNAVVDMAVARTSLITNAFQKKELMTE